MPRSIDIDFRWLISCRKPSLALALKLLGKQGATEDQYQRCRAKPTYSSSRSHLIRTVSSWMGPSVSQRPSLDPLKRSFFSGRYAANPGQPPYFRRRLPEIG